jgi:hypothetical protein
MVTDWSIFPLPPHNNSAHNFCDDSYSSRWAPRYFRPLKVGPIGYPATSVRNYHPSLSNMSQERRFLQHCRGKPKSCIFIYSSTISVYYIFLKVRVEDERSIKYPPFLYICKLANFQGTSHESYATWGRNFKFMKSVEMTRSMQKLACR